MTWTDSKKETVWTYLPIHTILENNPTQYTWLKVLPRPKWIPDATVIVYGGVLTGCCSNGTSISKRGSQLWLGNPLVLSFGSSRIALIEIFLKILHSLWLCISQDPCLMPNFTCLDPSIGVQHTWSLSILFLKKPEPHLLHAIIYQPNFDINWRGDNFWWVN